MNGCSGRIAALFTSTIDAPEAGDRRGYHCSHRIGIGDIGDVTSPATTGGFDVAQRTLHVAVRMQRVDHDVSPACGERTRDRAADVTGAAGDERDFAGQFAAWRESAGVSSRVSVR